MAILNYRRVAFVSLGLSFTNSDFMGVQWIVIYLFVVLLPHIFGLRLQVNKTQFENRLELLNEWFCAFLTILCSRFGELFPM